MIAVSAWLAFSRQPAARQRVLLIVGAMLIGGVASLVLSGTTNWVPALGLVALIGAGLAVFTPIAWGVLQELTPEEKRGRVFAILNTGAMSASMIGLVGFGWGTDRLGPSISLLGMASVFFLSTVASAWVWLRGHFAQPEEAEHPTHRVRATA